MSREGRARAQGSWREGAIDEALTAEALAGYALDALLREVREGLPGRSTLTFHDLEPRRYRAFLRERTVGLRSLLDGDHERVEDDGPVAAFSWHACRWEGEGLELIVPPGAGGRTLLIVGADPEALRAFGRELVAFCERPEGRALVYSSGEWASDPGLDAEIAKASWEDVVLAEDLEEEIRGAVEAFFSRRGVYRSLGFAWRRGILLVGPPGTGKTMLCKAVAASLEETPFLYVRDLSGRGAEESQIRDVFDRARKLAPCVLVIEDIDGFVDDENRAVFLNELDGFRSNEGVLVLASSNHPERVDEALLKRPSRFDRVFRVGLPGKAERRAYCARLLVRSGRLAAGLDAEELAERVARASEGFTPAYLKEAFVSAALERAHDEGAAVLDEAFARGLLAHVDGFKEYLRRARSPEKLADIHHSPDRRPGFRPGGRL